jgi:hypothetical protein
MGLLASDLVMAAKSQGLFPRKVPTVCECMGVHVVHAGTCVCVCVWCDVCVVYVQFGLGLLHCV